MKIDFFGTFWQRLSALLPGGDRFYCPLCEKNYRAFKTFGVIPRPNAMCPGCGSLERHRLLWMTLQKLWNSGKLPKDGKVLHVAPEESLTAKFKDGFDYLSADLNGSRAMVAMDITSIDFPAEYFDAVICNHVLEHIPDDRKALAELYRVLKTGGWASIQVPMKGEKTFEDLSVTDPKERERLFGQFDHVRQYGMDFLDRLREAGFEVQVLGKTDLFGPDELAKISVDCENEVVFALK